MRVCLIATTGVYPIDTGGPASVAYFLIKYFSKKGIELDVFIRANNDGLVNLFQSTEIMELGKENIHFYAFDYGPEDLKLKNILNLFKEFVRATGASVKRLREADIIVYNSPPIDLFFLLPLLAKMKHKKQIFVLHGGLFMVRQNGSYEINNIFGRIGRLLMKVYKNIFDIVVVVSDFGKEIAIEFGFPEKKIIVIPNGVDLKLFKKLEKVELEGSPKILYVGYLIPLKRVDTIIKAFKKILTRHPNAHLYLVGDGPEREKLDLLVSELKLNENVSFEGYVYGCDVYRYYSSCDLFILPSEKETFGIVLLEAMACKIPIIASQIPGFKDTLIEGKNCYLFKVGDYEELAKKVIELLSNENTKNAFVTYNYNLVKNTFSWEKIVEDYIKLFDKLVQQ
jgi:glycosyltransferase involved in cell wall biosynthesis